MDINFNKDVYCLIGNPIAKSLSPIINNSYYKIIGKNNIYLAFNVKEKDLADVINVFKILNIKGFNVTLPHKISIMEHLDSISDEAKILGAVNTVKNKNGRLIGYNTDGMGFLKSLELEDVGVKDKTVLVLGAGGAANAISISLAKEGVKKIIISNRTLSKAKILAEKISRKFPKVTSEYDSLKLKNVRKEKIDIIVNCTSVGMHPNIDESPINLHGFSENLIIYDIIYKPRRTKLMELAEKKGYYTINGLSMLINQALCSQEIWLEVEDYNFLKNYKEIKRILEIYVE
ncbi:Shikimate dehydrogenase [[Clostridium] ultunense Esp]|uniref:Shikimate dehydrogenase (NADP(+)) n=1 Tax=[Clostridium] ultunense Esp TaxID=1288971 RepID=M1YZF3_9FIRM|nr:shikimate dehydrogenase [Schnuerera ultunensis]CCQ95970.1 Shikimate dehydrogenase [[Clostridium] ultunense Esp]SHD77192.1 Shikimate dehydrogenase [[Clostridium] ultunense Esp]